MSRGEALGDVDRLPWLGVVRGTAAEHVGGVIVACSALKKRYRHILKTGVDPEVNEADEVDKYPTWFVWIKGEKSVLKERMESREGHYMKANMLDSQFADLEPPEGEEGVVVVPLELSPQEQLRVALDGLSELTGTRL